MISANSSRDRNHARSWQDRCFDSSRVEQHITPGITTKELDQIAEKTIQNMVLRHLLKDTTDFRGAYVLL